MSDQEAPLTEAPPNPQRIMQFAFAYAAPLMIEAAIRIGVFDTLDKAPKTVEELSRETEASVRGLRAILNGLVGLGLLSKNAEQQYLLTPDSATFLVSGKPSYHGGVIRHTSEQLLPQWLHLTEIVRTGKPAAPVNQEAEGSAFFQEFVESIFPMSYPAASALAVELKLNESLQPVHVLDLAAGSGVWGIALAQKSSHVHVTAVDWPGVLPVTRRTAERSGLAKRFHFKAGDLLDVDFGAGYNIATLGHILHSEGESRSKELLNKVFRSLAPGGTIAIAEMLTNADRTGPPHALIFAVNMLVNTDDGDTFSFEEISAWLTEAGFVDVRSMDTPGPSPLILAMKPM